MELADKFYFIFFLCVYYPSKFKTFHYCGLESPIFYRTHHHVFMLIWTRYHVSFAKPFVVG